MGAHSGIHDRALLDALEAIDPISFTDPVWRVCREGRDPAQSYPCRGRWDPGQFEVLYTSLEAEGAIREIAYHLSLQPVFPSKSRYNVHRLTVALRGALRLVDVAELASLGVPMSDYATTDFKKARRAIYPNTQAIGAAAHFLDFDGLIVPNARHDSNNLVIFTERVTRAQLPVVAESKPIDWSLWRP